jgi:hypothetical protein
MRFDLTSKKIPLTASQKLIAKLFGQQPVEISFYDESYSTVLFIFLTPLQGFEFGVMSFFDEQEPGLCSRDAPLEVCPLSVAEDQVA